MVPGSMTNSLPPGTLRPWRQSKNYATLRKTGITLCEEEPIIMLIMKSVVPTKNLVIRPAANIYNLFPDSLARSF